MIPKFRAFDKKTGKMIDYIVSINFVFGYVVYDEEKSMNKKILFSDIILMKSTGQYDKHGVEIFEGDIIQEVHAYEYANVEIETDYLEPFEIKKGNYVQGKWIAKEIGTEDFSVIGYVFGKNVKVIGDIYQNPELLEDV